MTDDEGERVGGGCEEGGEVGGKCKMIDNIKGKRHECGLIRYISWILNYFIFMFRMENQQVSGFFGAI